jgi:hypothetical protein
VWEQIIQRCTNPKSQAWATHGGRGITVCKRWRDSFDNFFVDVGPRPSDEFTIERKNNEKGYTKSNVRWATFAEQTRNMRTNRYVLYYGESRLLFDLAHEHDLAPCTIYARLKRGMTVEEAVDTPARRGGRRIWMEKQGPDYIRSTLQVKRTRRSVQLGSRRPRI